MRIDCGGRELDLDRPRIMGVLNVTPDSFSDGGRYADVDAAADRALAMVEAGAAIVDIGGESTRPGATPVSADEELDRVMPVLEALRPRTDVILSIDTVKPDVMRAARRAGADLINDVRALRAPGALEAAGATGAAICLMHMQGQPSTMQKAPRYADPVADIRAFLEQRIAACRKAGIPDDRLLVDPGFGFGKTLAHNMTLLGGLQQIVSLGRPVLVGMSRKSMFKGLLGIEDPEHRVTASAAAAAIAVTHGARIVRTHDIQATREAIEVAWAARSAVED